jgi:hypothetical protein
MSDLRILVAAALNSSDLSHSDIRETHIDRIGALAFANALGAALWALKWAGEARAYPRSVYLLSIRSRRICAEPVMRERLCHAGLLEWLDDLCHACGGRRMVVAEQVKRICTVCDGSGKRRHSDLWRARQLGLEPKAYRKWEPKFTAVQRKIFDAESQAWRDVAEQLGRREARHLKAKPVDLRERFATLATGWSAQQVVSTSYLPATSTCTAAAD